MNNKPIFILLAFLAMSTTAQAQSSCNATCMTNIAKQYMSDVVSQDWSKLPWAQQVRYSENNVGMMIGDGFWGAGPGTSNAPYMLADEITGNVLWYGITTEHGQAAYHALRLKISAGRISEVESYLGREGTPDQFAPVDSWKLDASFSSNMSANSQPASS